MIKPYEGTRKEVMLQLLELLMLKASSYTWKSVRGFYAHIAKQVELCRLDFNDAAQIRDAATIFFKHSDLRNSLPQPRSNTSAGGGSTSGDTNSRFSKPDAAQSKACRQWNYTGSCSCDKAVASYSGHHKCRVCAKFALCYIALSDVLPSPKLTSLRRSHRDSRAPTRLWTVSFPHRPRLYPWTYPTRTPISRISIFRLVILLPQQWFNIFWLPNRSLQTLLELVYR